MRESRAEGARRAWVALEAAKVLGHRWRRDWRAVPARERRRWVRVLAAGFAANVVLMVCLVWLVEGLEKAGRLSWEAGFLRWVERETGLSFGYAVVVQELGGPFLLSTLVVTGAAAAAWAGHPLRALSFVAAFFLLNPVTLLGWQLWERARPTLVEAGIATPGGLSAFPSGHVAHATALYGLFFGLWIRASGRRVERLLGGVLFLLVISLIALGRLRMGVHWPTDIAGGFSIGALWLAVLLYALHGVERDAGRRPSQPSVP